MGRGEDLWISGTPLRSEQAEPDLRYGRLGAPELKELVEVSGAGGDLCGDGAVDGDSGVLDIFEDALVGGGLAALVVLRVKSIDGYDDVKLSESLPVGGDDAESAGDDLGVDAASFDLGQEEFQFSMSDQRVAADKGDVQRFFFVQEIEYTLDELVSFEVGEVA